MPEQNESLDPNDREPTSNYPRPLGAPPLPSSQVPSITDRRTPGTPELMNAEATGEEQTAPASSPASALSSSEKTAEAARASANQLRAMTRRAVGLDWSELTNLSSAAREYPRSHLRAMRNFRRVDGPGLDHLTTLFEQYDSLVRAGHVNRLRARELLVAECIRVIFDAFSEEGPLT